MGKNKRKALCGGSILTTKVGETRYGAARYRWTRTGVRSGIGAGGSYLVRLGVRRVQASGLSSPSRAKAIARTSQPPKSPVVRHALVIEVIFQGENQGDSTHGVCPS